MALTSEVAQDPLDPARVDLGLGTDRRGVDGDLALPALARAAAIRNPSDHGPRRSVGSTSRAAAPASNRLISSRSASRSSKRSSSVCSSSAERASRRVEVRARVVDEVGRHPDRRQRGPQLVGHVGDEPLLDPGEPLELADLGLQARRPSR